MKYWNWLLGMGVLLGGGGPVRAEDAPPVAQGPNGHMYQFVDAGRPISFLDAKVRAAGMSYKGFKGHLLTVTSTEELQFVVKNVLTPLPSPGDCAWLGMMQKRGAAEPGGGWEWITGEPLEYKNWAPGEPNDTSRNEYLAQIRRDGVWGDVNRDMYVRYLVVEYEDPKGLPPAPPAEDLPQAWSGHYYQLVEAGRRLGWVDAKSIARSMTYQGLSGHLLTIGSPEEQAFVESKIAGKMRFEGDVAWLGGSQKPDSPEPAGGWTWVTGEPFGYTNWAPGQPDDAGQDESLLQMYRNGRWNDNSDSPTVYFIVEFEGPDEATKP